MCLLQVLRIVGIRVLRILINKFREFRLTNLKDKRLREIKLEILFKITIYNI